MDDTLLRGGLVDGEVTDIRVAGGVIAEMGTGVTAPAGAEVVDLDGYVLLPCAVEAHAHLDKAFLADVVPNRTGDLLGAIEAMGEHRSLLGVGETAERAVRAGRMMAANGYRAVRTHVDVTTSNGLISLDAVVEARAALEQMLDVQIVALAGQPVTGAAGADQRALLREALTRGADLLGGCPHLEDAGTRSATDVLVGIAADADVGIDLHTDETLDPTKLGLLDLVAARDEGFPHPITASHCVSLGMLPIDRQREIAHAVAAADIGVVVNPHTNLYLQGRSHDQAMPRGLTAVGALRAADVPLAAGQDNIQDPFNPLGRCDPFEVAGLMVLTAHLSPVDAFAAVSADAARVTGQLADALAPGAPADLIAVRAHGLREATAMAPRGDDRVVLRAGRAIVVDERPE